MILWGHPGLDIPLEHGHGRPKLPRPETCEIGDCKNPPDRRVRRLGNRWTCRTHVGRLTKYDDAYEDVPIVTPERRGASLADRRAAQADAEAHDAVLSMLAANHAHNGLVRS